MLKLKPKTEYRFWNKVHKTDKCWNWVAAKSKSGYGEFGIDYKIHLPHRISYQLLVGKIPKGLVLDHLCKNIVCVNPEHLEIVTSRENALRGNCPQAQNARKTHCQRGHILKGENLVMYRGMRSCRECRRRLTREYRQRKSPNLISNE